MSESIGKILQDARTRKGLSIEQVAQQTRIKIRYLEALENDQFDQFPSQAQTKGFLRMYAGLVDIPLQPLIDILTGKDEQTELVEAPAPPPPPAVRKLPGTEKLNQLGEVIKARLPAALQPPQKNETENNADKPVYNGPSSLEIFQEIGALTRSRRENLGLSLADIEEFTHVKSFYLKMIEDGDFLSLPSMVQARGMLNNYADFLDLDSDKVMLRYVDALQTLYIEKNGAAPNPEKKDRFGRKSGSLIPANWKRLLSTDMVFGASVILVILVLSIWGTIQITSMSNEKNSTQSGSISDVLMDDETPMVTGTVTEVNEVKMNPEGGQAVAQAAGEENPQIEATSTLVFTGSGPLQIYVVSRQRAWVRVNTDGKKVFEGRMLPGNAYPYSGNQQIEFITGNAAAIDLTYMQNGVQTDMGVLGTFGEVKSYIFTAQGVSTPTPRYTPTATTTPQPTLTQQPTPTVAQPTVTPYIP
ncbi:MAG: DUF4115 domain-containing protein [Anaerolineae bacterium]|nr:DUF4115 domain-containing protein [Anaerolineae bacterium]